MTGTERAICGWFKILGVATGGFGLALEVEFWVGVGGFKADAATYTPSAESMQNRDAYLPLRKTALPGPAPAVWVVQTPFARSGMATGRLGGAAKQ